MYLSTTRREIDHVQVEPEIGGHDLGRHRLPRARVAGEQPGDAAALRRAAAEAPLVEHPLAVAGAGGELAQPGDLLAAAAPDRRSRPPARRAGRSARARTRSAPAHRRGGRSGVTGPPRSAACCCAESAARAICSGPSRNWVVSAAASRPSAAAASPRLARHQPARSSGEASPTSTSTGTPRECAGFHEQVPYSTVGQPSSAKARTAGAPRATSTSSGPATSPAPRRRASRPAQLAMRCDVGVRREATEVEHDGRRRELGERRDREPGGRAVARAHAGTRAATRLAAPARAPRGRLRGRPGLAEQAAAAARPAGRRRAGTWSRGRGRAGRA